MINGQKVWTSSAHVADVALAVCRTDPDVPKHQGLTTFLVDMHAPGVEVRPLRQMTGSANFNEVFLTDVRVPDSHRVGELNKGFGVILTTLGNERTIATRAVVGTRHRTVRAVARGGRQLRRSSRRAPTPASRAALHRRPDQGAAHRAVARRAQARSDARSGDVDPQAPHVPPQHRARAHAHRGARAAPRRRHRASGARSRGTSTCSPRPAPASAAAPRRSCATRWGRRSWVSPRSPAPDQVATCSTSTGMPTMKAMLLKNS